MIFILHDDVILIKPTRWDIGPPLSWLCFVFQHLIDHTVAQWENSTEPESLQQPCNCLPADELNLIDNNISHHLHFQHQSDAESSGVEANFSITITVILYQC